MRNLLPFVLLIGVGGCGEDEAPPPAPQGGTPAAKRAAAGKKKPPPAFAERVRVEDRVLDPDEKRSIRHTFRDRDFAVDQNNRDPFQSFVLNQGLVNTSSDKLPMDRTKHCTRDDQMVASNYSYTDLRLVGIVAQGTQRKVLMMDSGNLGHIIKRGDCVGREKAVVKDIGTGYLTFQVEPDENAAGPARTVEEHSVQLYPNQMPVTSQPSFEADPTKPSMPDVAPPTTAPRVAPPEKPADSPE